MDYRDDEYEKQACGEAACQTRDVQAQQTNGMAVASLVFGSLSIVASCCLGGFPLGILGIVLSQISKTGESEYSSTAKAGLVTSIIGLVLSVLLVVAFVILLIALSYLGYETTPIR